MKVAHVVGSALLLFCVACGEGLDGPTDSADSHGLAVIIDAPTTLPEYLGHRVAVERTATVDCRAPETTALTGVVRCDYVVPTGEEVMLVASSATADFLGWSRGCDSEIFADGRNECRLVVVDDREIHARFGQP